MPETIQTVLSMARRKLSIVHDSAALDAEVLLSFILKKDRSYLYAWPEYILSETEAGQFEHLLAKRLKGNPVAYLTGKREFWSMMLNVSQDTLIPRPDTERIVELALEKIPQNKSYCIADLGTGSGAIALAIAKERPQCKITATDCSRKALEIAKDNAKQLGISNVSFQQGSWCEALGEKAYQMIVSNPPYIKSDDIHLTTGDVQFEPLQALESGEEGMDAIRQIAQQAHTYLEPGGWLMLEHGYTQRTDVLKLLRHLKYVSLDVFSDLAGMPRVCVGKREKQ